MDGSALKKVRRINIIAFVSVVLFMFIINSMVPYCCDDWHYMFVLHPKDHVYYLGTNIDYLIPDVNERLVSSFSDVLTSTKNQYFVMGGRAVNHFFVILFLWLADKWLFNILNSFVVAFLGLFIYKLAAPKKKGAMPWLLPLVYLLLFLLPDLGDNVFWLSGSFNYLWPSALVTGTLLVMRIYFYGKSRLKYALMLPLVLLASATNEVSGGMLGVVLLVWFLADENKKKNFFRYLFCVLIFLAGEAFVLAAPGNFNRAQNFNQVDIGDKHSISWACTHYLTYILEHYGWMLLMMGALWAFFRPLFKSSDIRMFSYAAGGLAGGVAFGLSGVEDPRVLFYPMAVLFVSFVICAVKLYGFLCEDHREELREYILGHRVSVFATLGSCLFLLLAIRGVHQIVINTLVFGYVLFWLWIYSRKTGGLGKIGFLGLFEYLYKKVWLIMLGVMAIPWVYFLIMGKTSLDGALHYTVVAVEVCAALFIVWFVKWSIDNDKIEKPKSKKVLDLYARFGPRAIIKRFKDSPVENTEKIMRFSVTAVAALMTFYLAKNTADVIPYYSKAREIYDGIEQAAQTEDKVYYYKSQQLLEVENGNTSILAVTHATLEPGHIPAGWIEEYYGITIKGDGKFNKSWSTRNLALMKAQREKES